MLYEVITKNDNLFYPGKSEGFIPINFNLDDLGKVIKGQFLYVAEDLSACNYGMKNFSNILPVEWEYDSRITSYNVCYTKLLRAPPIKYLRKAITSCLNCGNSATLFSISYHSASGYAARQ